MTCYDATAGIVAAQVPIVVTETGTDSCDGTWWNTFLSWLDAHQTSYQAWTWDTWGGSCPVLSLITDYSGTPTTNGQIFKNHLALLP